MIQRPVSPHLGIYRWLMTNTLSILHRITGFGLSVGSVMFVAWLWSAAYHPVFYEDLHGFFASLIGKILLFGWSAAFYYHLYNGIRHLVWDTGRGVDILSAYRTGKWVLVLTVLSTLGTWAHVMKTYPG